MTPEFRTERDARGELVICTLDGAEGRARVFTSGVEEAKARAEAQARAILKGQRAPD